MSQTPLQSANAVLDNLAAQTDSIIIMCSLGKDSLVCLDLAYPKFKRIVCVFMYFVKGLEHIERWINWLKARYPRVEFVQTPHWNLTYILHYGAYCVPQPNVKLMKLADVVKSLRLSTGIFNVILGMKKADGMNRNLMLRGYADNHYTNAGMVYPLAEWTQKHVLSYMRQHALPAPVRYSLKASSGIGFNIDCLKWMQDNFPGDLRLIYKTFPLAERVLWEHNQQSESPS